MNQPARVEAAFLIIGNEILSGRTQDSNLSTLAVKLNDIGIRVMECRVVADQEASIIEAVTALRRQYDYVFTSGGIGPTHDDITAACLAKAFNTTLERNPDAVSRLAAHYGDPAELTDARLKMAQIPVGASLIDNPVSAAPGFVLENVYVMAGVPKIFAAMVDGVLPNLRGGAPMLSKTVTSDLPESRIAAVLAEVEGRFEGVEIGSYPYFKLGQGGVSVVIRSTDQASVDQAAAAVHAGIIAAGGKANYLVSGLKHSA